MSFLIRLVTNAAAIWLAAYLVPGVVYADDWLALLGVAVVFAVVHAVVGTITKVMTFPFIILTFGILWLVINAGLLWLTSAVAQSLGIGFRVHGFTAAFFGAVVVSVVSTIISLALRDAKSSR